MGLAKSFEIYDSCNAILVLYESIEFTLIIITFIFITSLEDKGKLKTTGYLAGIEEDRPGKIPLSFPCFLQSPTIPLRGKIWD